MSKTAVHGARQTDAITGPAGLKPWIALFIFVMAVGFVFSIIQPLGGPADEDAHMAYVKFLADHHRLPVWQAAGGGEAGYESQHPPLYYTMAAVVYRLSSGLGENWRWHAVRWFSMLLSAGLFWIARRFYLDYFPNRAGPALTAAAAFSLTPTMILHMGYANVDILSVALSSVVFWMCVRLARGTAGRRDRVVLAVALGLGFLTKLTALGAIPIVMLAHFWDPQVRQGKEREQRMIRFLGSMLGPALIAGWWYARNSLLYGTPFVHTTGRFGSGLDVAAASGEGAHLVWFTLRESCLSLWAQRGWIQPGLPEIGLYLLVTGLIVIVAAKGLLRRRRNAGADFDPAPWLCGVFILSLFIGHQLQVWLVDYEFNAGGRYLLNGLMAVHALVISGLLGLTFGKRLVMLWVAVFLAMDLVSGVRIWTVLNPMYAPGWHIFHFRPARAETGRDMGHGAWVAGGPPKASLI